MKNSYCQRALARVPGCSRDRRGAEQGERGKAELSAGRVPAVRAGAQLT